jgi:hypothetical protein
MKRPCAGAPDARFADMSRTKTTATLALAFLAGCATHSVGNKNGSDGGIAGDASSPSGSADAAQPSGRDAAGDPDSADAHVGPGSDAGGDDRVTEVLTRLGNCTQVGGLFASDTENAANIPICGLTGAVFWKADMDVDCDGERSDVCNKDTDPWYQNQTSGKASDGSWLDASKLPYVVIPGRSDRFDYEAHGIDLGTVVAVIYKGKLAFGVFGDQGPDEIIGEASYAMAQTLGINPDPANGGTSDEVVYIAFQGEDARSAPLEDHDKAAALGSSLLDKFLAENH